MEVPPYGWFMMEDPNLKWMRTRGGPILWKPPNLNMVMVIFVLLTLRTMGVQVQWLLCANLPIKPGRQRLQKTSIDVASTFPMCLGLRLQTHDFHIHVPETNPISQERCWVALKHLKPLLFICIGLKRLKRQVSHPISIQGISWC